MSVYVDSAKNAYGRMKMCHMIADTPDELHAMADKIGVARKWFQKLSSFPHYDISQSKRELAVQNGAVELSTRLEMGQKMRDIRKAGIWTPALGGWQ